jgi:RNA polymerase sigma factor (sigma-70 family)
MESIWSQTPDPLIIGACLQGNEKAWQALVRRYKRLVYSIPVKWGLSPEDSEEIFREVWLDCFGQLSSVRHLERLQPWLIRAAVRKCRRFADGTEEKENGESAAAEDVAILFQLEKEQMLRSALDSLTPRCRLVLHCLFYEYPPPDFRAIASRTGLSEHKIGSTRERCLIKLKKVLDDLGYES